MELRPEGALRLDLFIGRGESRDETEQRVLSSFPQADRYRDTNWVYSVAFPPNDNEIATCDNCDIRIWNSDSSELVIPPIKVNAYSLARTPDGQRLIAARAHIRVVYSIAVSPNGKFIASTLWDNTVRLLDTMSSTRFGPILQHDDKMTSVAISSDGSHFVSGGKDSKVRIRSLKGVFLREHAADYEANVDLQLAPNLCPSAW
ncbi:tricorn protease domain 2-containing protein [Gyrodon lividus]|nr:tricorn protease domain 2-containing protein [Gyrodon lividus]